MSLSTYLARDHRFSLHPFFCSSSSDLASESFNRGATDKRTIVENYDLVALAIDEIIDDGVILETDPVLIASRVSRAPAADTPNMKNIDLSEQGLLNVWEFGKRRLAEGLRQGLQ